MGLILTIPGLYEPVALTELPFIALESIIAIIEIRVLAARTSCEVWCEVRHSQK
jgi:hypothetical protein